MLVVGNGFVWHTHLPTQIGRFYPKHFLYLPKKTQFLKQNNFSHPLWKNWSPQKQKLLLKKILILYLKKQFLKIFKKHFCCHLKEPITWPTDLAKPPRKKFLTLILKRIFFMLKQKSFYTFPKIFFCLEKYHVRKTSVSLYLWSIFVFLCVIFFSILN